MRRTHLLAIADGYLPVPPKGYGGVERWMAYLLEGLADRGYQITLVGARGSRPPGRLIAYSDRRDAPRPVRGAAKLAFWLRLLTVLQTQRIDLVHSVARLDYIVPALQSRVPKVLSFHNPVDPSQVTFVRRTARGPTILTSVGAAMIEHVRHIGVWRPIHNAVPVAHFTYSPRVDAGAYLAFLGRLTPTKGAHTAIRIAHATGRRLVIGGNVGSAPGDAAYFEREIRPHLDGDRVTYVGELDDQGKQRLLGGALALLMPVEWDDPCPAVSIEALACGTPVVAAARGELVHLIRDGLTGWVCPDEAAMIAAVSKIGQLARADCRHEAERRFDVSRMLDEFEEVYAWALHNHAP